MKKNRLLLLGILMAVTLTACGEGSTDNSKDSILQSGTDETQTESEEKWVISEIKNDFEWQKPRANNVNEAKEAELFFEDEKYKYYFEYAKSDDINVVYENRTKENVKAAFAAGHVDIYDLGQAGIGCFVVEKNPQEDAKKVIINIVDEAVYADLACERIYEDDDYLYYFTDMRSNQVFVYYTDGTRERINHALAAGRATIQDMDTYCVGYYKRDNIIDVVDLTENGKIECAQEKETLFEYAGYSYYFDCVKSMYIEIHYKNGKVETLRDAIDSRTDVKSLQELVRSIWDYSFDLHCEAVI